jgi:hypothetical protein
MGSRPLVAFGNETYKLNLTNYNYKYNNYTRNPVGRSFGSEYVPSADGDRIQSPKRRVLIKYRTMDNVQNCDN